jgi:Phage Mu protein F like protein/Contact-dependent growth inhibition CdiA C-terminal domain
MKNKHQHKSESFFLSDNKKKELGIDTDKITDKVINQLHDKGKLTTEQKKELFKSMYKPLKEGVNEGFGKNRIEYGTPNAEFLKQLQTNTAIFSIFKSYAYQKELIGALKDEHGNLKSKEQFRQDALKIDSTYNQNHLNTQYDTAVRSARMAVIWKRCEQTKDLYPSVKYVPSRAAHPREDHKKYYGLIFHLSDPILKTIWPPNGWNCQCGMEPTDEDPTALPHDLPEIDEAFRFNPGITGEVFDLKNNSYIDSFPLKEQPALIKEAKKYVNKDFVLDNEDALTEDAYKSKSGGTVEINRMAYNNTDFKEVYREARSLANFGEKVTILPDTNDTDIRSKFLPEKTKDGKNPDYIINDKFIADLKIVYEATKRAVQGAISNCHKQCNNIVLKIDENNVIVSADLFRYIKGNMSRKEYKDFENLWIFFNGEWKVFTRTDILKGKWF